MKIYGIDVSHHQGAINWQRTASELRRVNGGSNPGFALLRVRSEEHTSELQSR